VLLPYPYPYPCRAVLEVASFLVLAASFLAGLVEAVLLRSYQVLVGLVVASYQVASYQVVPLALLEAASLSGHQVA